MNPKRRKLVTRKIMKRQSNSEEVLQNKKRQRSNRNKEFPNDIVMEILSRLPVKSLCRFKCVCKFWSTLTSDSYFVKLQLNQSIKANRLTYVLYANHDFPRRLELDYESLISGHEAKPTADDCLFGLKMRGPNKNFRLSRCRRMEVWGCCNGLLCIFADPKYLVLANLSTREIKTIFSCYRSWLGGGFGYDAFHDDYKVVKISFRKKIRTVDIYSLKKDSWSCHGNFPQVRAKIHGFRSLYFNGAIYWVACSPIQKHAFIIAFDLTKEEFFDIPAPNPIDGDNIFRYELYTERGCLCMMPYNMQYFPPINEIWIMEIYGVKDSWKRISLTFSYDLSLIPLNFPNSEATLFLINGSLFLYNHRNGCRKEVTMGQIPAAYLGRKLNKAFCYVESLVSLGSTTGMPKHSRKLRSQKEAKDQKIQDLWI